METKAACKARIGKRGPGISELIVDAKGSGALPHALPLM